MVAARPSNGQHIFITHSDRTAHNLRSVSADMHGFDHQLGDPRRLARTGRSVFSADRFESSSSLSRFLRVAVTWLEDQPFYGFW